MSTACPNCGSRNVRPSRTKDPTDKTGLFKSAFRCRDCRERFVAPVFILRDLFYARCPVCCRMDLNGWTGKTYTDPPLKVAMKIGLGAYRWRCEYCRLNFASFRRRKEVFTFKRWKRWGHQAEDHEQEKAPQTGETKSFKAKA